MKLFVYVLLINICVVHCGRNFYDILGVSRSATRHEIKKAYRQAAKEKHPDKNKDDPNAEVIFRDINDAHEVLSNDEKRKVYDRYGEDGLKQFDSGGGGGAADDLADLFGFRRRSNDEPRGGDVHMDLWVTLEELYMGESIEVVRQKLIKKPAHGMRKCNCRMEFRTVMVGPGRFQMSQEEVCSECPNIEFIPGDRILDVEIESGMRDGQVYPFKGEGEPHIDGDAGDLKLVIRQLKHKVFHRRDDDLYTNLSLTLVEALNGFHVSITHLDGHKVVMKTSKVTAPGTIIRKPDEGMPNFENPKVKGSLYITVDVEFPKGRELTDGEREMVRKIFTASDSASNENDQSELPKPAAVYNSLDRFLTPLQEKVTT